MDYSDPYPADSEQFMLIEELYKQSDKLQERVDSMLHNEVNITALEKADEKLQRELHGLTRVLIANMDEGVSNGFQKELQLIGVGYSADASKGNYLVLNLGYSHLIYFEKPDGITIETPNTTSIIIKGISKQEVGQVAANIRELRKPEPYKGKGIRYVDEYVRKKAGKSIGVGEV